MLGRSGGAGEVGPLALHSRLKRGVAAAVNEVLEDRSRRSLSGSTIAPHRYIVRSEEAKRRRCVSLHPHSAVGLGRAAVGVGLGCRTRLPTVRLASIYRLARASRRARFERSVHGPPLIPGDRVRGHGGAADEAVRSSQTGGAGGSLMATTSGPGSARMLRIVCIVSFLDEEHHLRRFLTSLAAQHRRPEELLLVDDGSSDASPNLADEFAKRYPGARVLRRPRRPPVPDRLVDAPELRAFQWALAQASEPWDVVVKMDADLVLSPDLFATLEQTFLAHPTLGIAGTYLSVVDPQTGQPRRERCPPQHARGPNKFYRRACYEQIAPFPTILGWDTIDEIAARRHGWRTASVACPAGDSIHLRPTGAHDGLIRAQFRWGACAYGIGQHPLWVTASSLRRLGDRPPLLAAGAFLAGWLWSAVRRRPRASPELRAFGRHEQLTALRDLVRALPHSPRAIRNESHPGAELIGRP